MNFESVFSEFGRGELARTLSSVEALRKVVGAGVEGIEAALARDLTDLELSIIIGDATKYHEIARRTVALGYDRKGVQAKRLEYMERLINFYLFDR